MVMSVTTQIIFPYMSDAHAPAMDIRMSPQDTAMALSFWYWYLDTPCKPSKSGKRPSQFSSKSIPTRGGSSRGRLRVASRVSDRLPLRGRFFAGARRGLTASVRLSSRPNASRQQQAGSGRGRPPANSIWDPRPGGTLPQRRDWQGNRLQGASSCKKRVAPQADLECALETCRTQKCPP